MSLPDPREYRALGYLIDSTSSFVRALREWDRVDVLELFKRSSRQTRYFRYFEIKGITEFEAEMLPSNTKMLEVFTHSGYELKRSRDQDGIRVVFPIHDERIPF